MTPTQEVALFEWWGDTWLPRYPLASDDLRDGIFRVSRENALGLRYIEANPHAFSNLLVVDIDHNDSTLRALWDRDGWRPNVIAENSANGHAHAVWALRSGISRTEYSRRKPLAYAAAITEGLRRSVDGDQGYSGLITKNPSHDSWESHWVTDHLYELQELQEHLDAAGFMPPASWTRTRRKAPVGLSRNCDIFESARIWAYRAARQIRLRSEYPTRADFAELHAAISTEVHTLNASYNEPLPLSEVKAITTSIHKWITTSFTGWSNSRTTNNDTFARIQQRRGIKSGQARRSTEADRLTQLTDLLKEI